MTRRLATYPSDATRADSAPKGGSGVAIAGLDFPASPAGSTRFRFANPQANGLPIYPATYIWRCFPRAKNGFFTAFFWGNDGEFWWDSGSPNTYYGAHPWPPGGGGAAGQHWEISVGGGDFTTDDNGNDTTVVFNRWYTQALRVLSDGSGKHHEFYWDLDAGATRIITRDESTGYANSNPPNPALTWGDAPWSPGNEGWNGILRGIQIYNAALTLTDIQTERANHTINAAQTSAGQAALWYINQSPIPGDISNKKAGATVHPAWFDEDHVATLWTP